MKILNILKYININIKNIYYWPIINKMNYNEEYIDYDKML
jgi:hypothetical protein